MYITEFQNVSTINNTSIEELNSAQDVTPDVRNLSHVTQTCVNATTVTKMTPTASHDALLYIVVVLLFYAFSMVILMVKYVRREKEEAEMAHYYSEYVARERFKTPMFEIRNYMQRLKEQSVLVQQLHEDDEDFVSCLEVPLVASEQKLHFGEQTSI